MDDVRLLLGDCTELLPTLPSASVDVVLTDPPYPCIKREYGVWTEAEWFTMMRRVVPECMRILKPTGSAVFILQPNSERVGRMRTWLWEFMLWVGKEWGIVQDAWWWNHSTPPTVHCHETNGMMRPSIKACVWIAGADCFRQQSEILLEPAAATLKDKRWKMHELRTSPSGLSMRHGRAIGRMLERGGSTPFNLIPMGNGELNRHPGSTPSRLAAWWLRYLCPPGGTVLDPFVGSGTVALEAMKQGKSAIGIERIEKYHAIAEKRIAAACQKEGLYA